MINNKEDQSPSSIWQNEAKSNRKWRRFLFEVCGNQGPFPGFAVICRKFRRRYHERKRAVQTSILAANAHGNSNVHRGQYLHHLAALYLHHFFGLHHIVHSLFQ